MKKGKAMVQEIKEFVGKELKVFRQDFGDELKDFRQDFGKELRGYVGKELKDFRQDFGNELKGYVGKELKDFRQDFGNELRGYVGKELKDFRQDFGKELRGYVGKEIKGLKEYVNQKVDSGIDEAKRHTGVVVEGLGSEVKIVAEQYGSFVNRFNRIDAKLEGHDRRFDGVDIRLGRIELDLKAMNNALFDNSHRLNDHDARIRKLEMS